jgi:hypothetical protein
LSSTGDYTFGQSEADFYRDVPEAEGQAAQTRLLLWLGEFFLNIESGTPYMQGVLGKYSKATAEATLQDRILGTQGATEVNNIVSEIDPETRRMTLSCELETIYGPTRVEVANSRNY